MSYAADYDALLAEQPEDWAFFEVHLTVDDPRRLADARVALARANGRPVRGPGDHDFEVTVANRWGHGAGAGVVRSALRLMDDLGIQGRIWCGQTFDLMRPAPPHRYGPQGVAVYRDEADLELLAELAGVLDRTVTDAGLGPGGYLVLRQLATADEPQAITGIAERLKAHPDEVVAQAERLMTIGFAEASGRGLSATESGRGAVTALEETANANMLAYVLDRPHTATVYGLVAAMQSGRFTVEDLLAFLAEGDEEDEDEEDAGDDPGAEYREPS